MCISCFGVGEALFHTFDFYKNHVRSTLFYKLREKLKVDVT